MRGAPAGVCFWPGRAPGRGPTGKRPGAGREAAGFRRGKRGRPGSPPPTGETPVVVGHGPSRQRLFVPYSPQRCARENCYAACPARVPRVSRPISRGGNGRCAHRAGNGRRRTGADPWRPPPHPPLTPPPRCCVRHGRVSTLGLSVLLLRIGPGSAPSGAHRRYRAARPGTIGGAVRRAPAGRRHGRTPVRHRQAAQQDQRGGAAHGTGRTPGACPVPPGRRGFAEWGETRACRGTRRN